jgi:hypothetical protein
MQFYALEQELGFSIPARHAVSIAIHLLNAALIVCFIATILPGRKWACIAPAAAVASLFFGCHPQNVGAVGWLAARFDLLVCLFGGAGLLLWMLAYASPRPGLIRVGAVLAFAAAMLSKETAVAFVIAAAATSLVPDWNRSSGRARVLAHLSILAAVTACYFAWRLAVLGSLGGYESHDSFNWRAVFYFALVDLWPAMQLPRDVGAYAWILIAAAAGLVWFARKPDGEAVRAPISRMLPVVLLFFLLLALCVRFGMNKYLIMARAESRYSYTHVFAVAILLGVFLACLRPRAFAWASRILLVAWLLPAIALQQHEIKNWKDADRTVQSIIGQTVKLVPDPKPNAVFAFWGVPLTTKKYCYVFGLGLEEALAEAYGRDNIRVIRYGGETERKHPAPEMYRLDYNWDADTMRLIPEWAR